MKYKLIASDLDETLLDEQKNIGDKTLEAIKKAKDLGVYFVPNTGRGFTLIRKTIDQLNVTDKENEYVVSFNGSAITENKNENVLSYDLMNYEEINQLFKIGVENNLPMHIYTLREIYVYNLNEDEKDYLSRMGFDYIELTEPSLDKLADEQWVKILFMDKDQDNLKSIYETIPQGIKDDTSVTYSSNRYMEFNKTGIDKGYGLLKLADILNVKPVEIIAVGDNMNDLPMLKTAGLAVAVQNAVPEVKTVADYVTESDFNNDAVAEIIEKFIL